MHTATVVKGRLIALLIILLAFGMRIYALDKVWHDTDSGFPHGLAIETLESIQDGHFEDPRPHFYISSIGLPNPVAAVYFWMLIALIDRSPYTAFAISAMLNVLAVAMTYDLAKRLFGRTPALVAALLFATSPWSIFISRNTNLPGQLEFSAVASAWLVFMALKRINRRMLIGGFVLTAIVIHTYAVALALIGMIGAVMLVTRASARKLFRIVIAGFVLLAVSAALQFTPYLFTRSQDSNSQPYNPAKALGAYPSQSDSIPNPFGLHLNLEAFDHALRMASGRDFQNAQMWRDATDFWLLDRLGILRAGVIDALILIGVLTAIVRSRRDIGSRMTLTWFLVPTVIATVLMAIFTTLHTTYYYMIIASPAGYLLAGIPFIFVDRLSVVQPADRMLKSQHIASILAGVILVVASLGQILVSTLHMVGYTDFVAHEPPPQEMPRGPLSWHLPLGNLWRTQCKEIDDPWTRYWIVSVLESAHPLRNGTYRSNADSNVWHVSAAGGNCAMALSGPAPVLADALPLPLNDHIQIDIYRSQPINQNGPLFTHATGIPTAELVAIPGSNLYEMVNATGPLQINLNWTLLDLATTQSAQAGQWITVSQVMRVDALPADSHWNWYFAPFITLSTADDKQVLQVNDAVALEGWQWKQGDIIMSTVRIKVPVNAAAGGYKLKMSLFDPNQKINAVYFSATAPGKPIIDLQRPVSITGPAK